MDEWSIFLKNISSSLFIVVPFWNCKTAWIAAFSGKFAPVVLLTKICSTSKKILNPRVGVFLFRKVCRLQRLFNGTSPGVLDPAAQFFFEYWKRRCRLRDLWGFDFPLSEAGQSHLILQRSKIDCEDYAGGKDKNIVTEYLCLERRLMLAGTLLSAWGAWEREIRKISHPNQVVYKLCTTDWQNRERLCNYLICAELKVMHNQAIIHNSILN